MIQKYSALVACALIASAVITTATARVAAQNRAAGRPDLSGSWQLNRELIVTARVDMQGRRVSIRRIYDSVAR